MNFVVFKLPNLAPSPLPSLSSAMLTIKTEISTSINCKQPENSMEALHLFILFLHFFKTLCVYFWKVSFSFTSLWFFYSCVYICLYMLVYVFVYVSVRVYLLVYTSVCACACICISMCVCLCMHLLLHS